MLTPIQQQLKEVFKELRRVQAQIINFIKNIPNSVQLVYSADMNVYYPYEVDWDDIKDDFKYLQFLLRDYKIVGVEFTDLSSPLALEPEVINYSFTMVISNKKEYSEIDPESVLLEKQEFEPIKSFEIISELGDVELGLTLDLARIDELEVLF